MDETLAIARTLVADGIEVVACTPHVRHDYPTAPETMEAAVADVQRAVAAAGIRLQVLPGGELSLEKVVELAPDDLIRFGLGGNPRLLLVEFPYYGVPLALPEIVSDLGRKASGSWSRTPRGMPTSRHDRLWSSRSCWPGP